MTSEETLNESLVEENKMKDEKMEKYEENIKDWIKLRKQLNVDINSFNQTFEQTLINFQTNMDFLNRQSQDIQKLVSNIEKVQEKSHKNLGKMNSNVSRISKNVDSVDKTLQKIKRK